MSQPPCKPLSQQFTWLVTSVHPSILNPRAISNACHSSRIQLGAADVLYSFMQVKLNRFLCFFVQQSRAAHKIFRESVPSHSCIIFKYFFSCLCHPLVQHDQQLHLRKLCYFTVFFFISGQFQPSLSLFSWDHCNGAIAQKV